jgi:enterochelin esterase family protein
MQKSATTDDSLVNHRQGPGLKQPSFICVFIIILIFTQHLQSSSFPSVYSEFKDTLLAITSISNTLERDKKIDELWSSLKSARQIPYKVRDSVMFLYRGSANSVGWYGDFNSWSGASFNSGVTRLPGNIWYLEKTFPSDARLDYKIVLNGSTWMLDPDNTYRQMGGYGYNSVLRMPDYIFPMDVIPRNDTEKGILSSNITIGSTSLGYSVQYKVYTPAGYDNLYDLPVLYVTDGSEYYNVNMGSVPIVLDNLIHDGKILPVMAVFIDPVAPGGGTNRRMSEYNMNPAFADFLAVELVPQIDSTYKTRPAPDSRCILGTSMGGLNSAYIGAVKPETFQLIAIQSPAFWYNPEIYSLYSDESLRPLRIWMSTGVIHDTQAGALEMKTILESKGYPLFYLEVNESHSWGSWRGQIDDILIHFWEDTTYVSVASDGITNPNTHLLVEAYPNPFNNVITFTITAPSASGRGELLISDVSGRVIFRINVMLTEGNTYQIPLDFTGLASGIYFYTLRLPYQSQSGRVILMK